MVKLLFMDSSLRILFTLTTHLIPTSFLICEQFYSRILMELIRMNYFYPVADCTSKKDVNLWDEVR